MDFLLLLNIYYAILAQSALKDIHEKIYWHILFKWHIISI